jgi:outer membrane protein assembly factor BamB
MGLKDVTMKIQSAFLLMMTLLPCAANASEVDTLYALAKDHAGLVVHYDCGDGELTAALGQRNGAIVQGLTRDADQVATARERIHASGLSGPVSIRLWTTKRLPYADNVVNVLIASSSIQGQEAIRVLAPGGVLLTRKPLTDLPANLKAVDSSGGWQSFIKPVPAEIDEWTHYLHSANNNAVASDSLIGPPRYLRWDGGPKYSRNHEIDSSVVSAVTGGGRLFYVVDEGPPGTMGRYLPQKWALIARDAFSGVILWRRPIPNMGWQEWKPSINAAGWGSKLGASQRRLIPITLPRRLVVEGDRLYTSLGYHAPLVALDAATGKIVKTWEDVDGLDEVLVQGCMVIAITRPKSRAAYDKPRDPIWDTKFRETIEYAGEIVALDQESGRVLWRHPAHNLEPLTLTATTESVVYHNRKEIVCLDRLTGKQQWVTENDNAESYRWNVSQTILAHDDVLLVGSQQKIEAYSLKTGKRLWESAGTPKPFGDSYPSNLFVIDDLVWAPGSDQSRVLKGLNLHTGKVERSISAPQYLFTAGHHIRCYRSKATERYILDNKRGIEMIGMDGKSFSKNDWVRGICRYGVLPANGLIYSTPTPCSCYTETMLTGFNALSSTREPRVPSTDLRQGPAFGTTGPVAGRDDWPTFRGNPIRSGSTDVSVNAKPAQAWTTQLGGKLTQPIIAAGKLFVASVHQHTLYALDEATGKVLWQYTADGRIDSPPTYHKGVLYFGTRTGRLHALAAADGREVWQYRIAPTEEQIVSYNQLESVWPVHGSTLVVDDVVYAAAGRNVYLDGGIHVVALDCATGGVRYKAHFESKPQDPTEKGEGDDHYLPGVAMDVMQHDGTHLHLGNKILDKTLKEQQASQALCVQAAGGFLDDLTWNRNVWRYSTYYTAWSARKEQNNMMSGQLLVHDHDHLYGVQYFLVNIGKSVVNYPGQKGYRVFSSSLDAVNKYVSDTSLEEDRMKLKWKNQKLPEDNAPLGPPNAVPWQSWIPVRVRAMVKAGDTLLVAGPSDTIDESDPLGPYEGRGEALLRSFGATDGNPQAEITLPAQPVFDGMVVANGNLYIAHTSGELSCWQ